MRGSVDNPQLKNGPARERPDMALVREAGRIAAGMPGAEGTSVEQLQWAIEFYEARLSGAEQTLREKLAGKFGLAQETIGHWSRWLRGERGREETALTLEEQISQAAGTAAEIFNQHRTASGEEEVWSFVERKVTKEGKPPRIRGPERGHVSAFFGELMKTPKFAALDYVGREKAIKQLFSPDQAHTLELDEQTASLLSIELRRHLRTLAAQALMEVKSAFEAETEKEEQERRKLLPMFKMTPRLAQLAAAAGIVALTYTARGLMGPTLARAAETGKASAITWVMPKKGTPEVAAKPGAVTEAKESTLYQVSAETSGPARLEVGSQVQIPELGVGAGTISQGEWLATQDSQEDMNIASFAGDVIPKVGSGLTTLIFLHGGLGSRGEINPGQKLVDGVKPGDTVRLVSGGGSTVLLIKEIVRGVTDDLLTDENGLMDFNKYAEQSGGMGVIESGDGLVVFQVCDEEVDPATGKHKRVLVSAVPQAEVYQELADKGPQTPA